MVMVYVPGSIPAYISPSITLLSGASFQKHYQVIKDTERKSNIQES